MIVRDRTRRVTTETAWRFFGRNLPAQSILERVRDPFRMVRRNIETHPVEEADARLVKIAFVLKQKTLSPTAAAESPQERRRE